MSFIQPRYLFRLLSSVLIVFYRNIGILFFSILLVVNEFLVLGIFVLIATIFFHQFHIVLKLHDYLFSAEHAYNWVYISLYFICLIYSAMILHSALIIYLWERIQPKRGAVSIIRSIREALSKFKIINQLLVFHFTIAFVLNASEWWSRWLTKHNERKFGIRWFLARNFIFPVMIIENCSPSKAWQHMGRLIQERFDLPAKKIVNLFWTFNLLLWLGVAIVFFWLFTHTTQASRWLIGFGIYFAVIILFYQMFAIILQLVLYDYLKSNEIAEGFDQEVLDNMVQSSIF